MEEITSDTSVGAKGLKFSYGNHVIQTLSDDTPLASYSYQNSLVVPKNHNVIASIEEIPN